MKKCFLNRLAYRRIHITTQSAKRTCRSKANVVDFSHSTKPHLPTIIFITIILYQWPIIHLSSQSNLGSHDFPSLTYQNTLVTLAIFPLTKSFVPFQSCANAVMLASCTERCLLCWLKCWSLYNWHDSEKDLVFKFDLTYDWNTLSTLYHRLWFEATELAINVTLNERRTTKSYKKGGKLCNPFPQTHFPPIPILISRPFHKYHVKSPKYLLGNFQNNFRKCQKIVWIS